MRSNILKRPGLTTQLIFSPTIGLLRMESNTLTECRANDSPYIGFMFGSRGCVNVNAHLPSPLHSPTSCSTSSHSILRSTFGLSLGSLPCDSSNPLSSKSYVAYILHLITLGYQQSLISVSPNSIDLGRCGSSVAFATVNKTTVHNHHHLVWCLLPFACVVLFLFVVVGDSSLITLTVLADQSGSGASF